MVQPTITSAGMILCSALNSLPGSPGGSYPGQELRLGCRRGGMCWSSSVRAVMRWKGPCPA